VRIRRIGATALSALTGSISDAQHGSRGSSLHTDAHANTNDPTANQKAALAGTGTPSATDKYVSDSDARNTNSRTPTAHAIDGALHSGVLAGELGGTLAAPTVDAVHSGSSHAATQTAAEATASSALTTHAAVSAASTHGNLGHSNANDHANTLDHARQHSTTSASDHTFPGGTTTFLRADGTYATPTASPPVLVGPNNLVSTVEAIAANTYVHVGRQLEIASTGSIEIPATSTLEITA
jgi:hypothetical protein